MNPDYPTALSVVPLPPPPRAGWPEPALAMYANRLTSLGEQTTRRLTEQRDLAAADAVRMAREALRQHDEWDTDGGVDYCLGCAGGAWPCSVRADALAVIDRWEVRDA